MPIYAGCTPATAHPFKKAMGFSPNSSSLSPATTRHTDAASFCELALPAVTVPPGVTDAASQAPPGRYPCVALHRPGTAWGRHAAVGWTLAQFLRQTCRSPPRLQRTDDCAGRRASCSSRVIWWRSDKFSAVSIMPEMTPKRSSGEAVARARIRRSCRVTDPKRLPQRISVGIKLHPAHTLHTAGQHHVGIARLHHHAGIENRLQA